MSNQWRLVIFFFFGGRGKSLHGGLSNSYANLLNKYEIGCKLKISFIDIGIISIISQQFNNKEIKKLNNINIY